MSAAGEGYRTQLGRRNQLAHRYQLELYRDESTSGVPPLSTVALDGVDWQPALESAIWAVTRQRPHRPIVLDTGDGIIEPSWHPTFGEPYIDGVEVSFGNGNAAMAPLKVPVTFFGSAASAASQALVSEGTLSDGEQYRYRVSAYPSRRTSTESHDAGGAAAVDPAGTAGSVFSVETVAPSLPVQEVLLPPLIQRGELNGQVFGDEMPVFLPRNVLDEVTGLTSAAGAAETGGILIGHLRVDDQVPDVFVEVTAQITAAHAQEELTSLTFTPDTWSAVDAALKIRRRQEIYLGWWHSHPVRQWCAECPEEKRKNCKLSGEFFSSHDIALHRCCFPRGYSIALVISDATATGLTPALYGWRNGMVMRRGFYVLDD